MSETGDDSTTKSRVLDPLEPKDYTEDLKLALKPFEETNIPVQTWTTTELSQHFVQPKRLISNVKIITSITNNAVRDDVMSLAIQRGFWTENPNCTPKTLMKFCDFLKTIEGSKILSGFYKKAKLNKKAKLSGLDADGLTHVTMLKRQLSELAAAKKRRRADIVAEIAEQRRRIALLERELKKEAVEVESRYVPACEYVPLDEVDFLRRCYGMYVGECGEKGEEVRELNEEVIKFVKGKYGEAVRRVHMHEFVVSENRKDVLKGWDEERNKTEHGVSL